MHINKSKFKALGCTYDLTYLTPFYFTGVNFKALGTVYNLSFKEVDKYHDVIDYGFKRKWINKNTINNCKSNFNGKKYQSYNLNGKKPDLYFYNHAYKNLNIIAIKRSNDKFDSRTSKWFYDRLERFKKKKEKKKCLMVKISDRKEVKEVIKDNVEIRFDDNSITIYSNKKVTNYIPNSNVIKTYHSRNGEIKIIVRNYWDEEYGKKIYGG